TPGSKLTAAARTVPEPTEMAAGVGLPARGLLSVSLDDATNAWTPDERARIYDAINALNDSLVAVGTRLIPVDNNSAAWSDLHVRTDTASPCGSAADGVLGCETTGGEIIIVQGWDWYTGPDPSLIDANQYDYETVVMHELGHGIGLDHSADPNSVMYGTLSTGQARRTLGATDIGAHDVAL